MNIYLDYNWNEEYLSIEGRVNDLDSLDLRALDMTLDELNTSQYWSIELYLKMADFGLDTQCATSDSYFARIDSSMKSKFKPVPSQPHQKHFEAEKAEVVVYEDASTLTLRHITVMLKVRLSEMSSPPFIVPHLFGSLSHTEAGVEILRGRMVAEGLHDKLENPQTSLAELKGILWAIGFIGSTSHGMKYLSDVEGLIEKVFFIAQNTQELPLKSIALNVVNMFAQNFVGRDLLDDHNWSVHALKQDESGDCDFITTPKNISTFLKISPLDPLSDPFLLPSKYTDLCRGLISQIKDTNDDEKEREFIEMVEKLPNRQNPSKPVNAWVHGKDFSLFNNTKLFYLLFIMLTCYNMPVSVRRNLYAVSDYFLMGLNFIVLLDNDPDFQEFLKL